MMHINVETMTVTTPVYSMFIELSFVVCPADCGVTVNQKYVSYNILNTTKCVKIKKENRNLSLMENKDYQFYHFSSSNQHYNISTITCTINLPIGVTPLIHQSELKTYTKVVPFQEKSSFHCVVL
jgi:hypothetical protein